MGRWPTKNMKWSCWAKPTAWSCREVGREVPGVPLTTNPNMQFRWFARQLQPLLRAYAVSVSLIVLSSLMFLLDPLLIKWLIDRILPKKDFHLLFLAAAGFFGISYAVFCLKKKKVVLSFRTVQDIIFRIL